jgi:hypothetical protein
MVKKVSEDQVSQVMRDLVNRRWRKTGKKERSELGKKAAQARWGTKRKEGKQWSAPQK